MSELSDAKLLGDYAERQDESAFREIVNRHGSLVYSAALRQVESSDLAGDVAQMVFTDLARKARVVAGQMADNSSLVGWLYQSTRFAALNQSRATRRRLTNERQAMDQMLANSETALDWERIRPLLDEAMAGLAEADRDAVLLRYFQGQEFRVVGGTLGISEDAAQKRVSRAIERLRIFFTHRGVALTGAAIAGAVSANAVQGMPVGFAAKISTMALLTGTVTTTSIATMNMLNVKTITAVLASALAVGTATYLVQQREVNRLRTANENLLAQQERSADGREAARVATNDDLQELERLRKNESELLRLRGEVGTLRLQAKELDRLREQNRRLQAMRAGPGGSQENQESGDQDTPQRRVAIAKMNDARLLVLSMILYADDHQDSFPVDLGQSSNYLANAETPLTNTNQFELVIHGSVNAISNANGIIAVREVAPTFMGDKWIKAYGFVDGHSEIRNEPPEGFEAWERKHMLPTPSSP